MHPLIYYTQRAHPLTGVAVSALLLSLLAEPVDAQVGWSNPINLDNSHKRFSINPSFDFDGNGHIHGSWTDFLDSSRIVRYVTNATGVWQKSDVPVPGLSGARNTNRVIVTPDQVIHLFLNADGGSPSQTHSWELTKPVNGGTWSTPQQITDPTVGGNFGWAAMDVSGGIYAVWVKIRFDPNHGELYGRYKPLGSAWGPIETIRTTTSNGWPSGNFVTAQGNRFYIGYNTSAAIPWFKVRDNGVLGPERQVAASGFSPWVIEDPGTGELVAVYHIDWKNWFVTSSDGGINWSTPMPLSEGSFFDRHIIATFDGNGDFHVAWRKTQNENQGSTCYFRSRIRGVWRDQQDISPWNLKNAGPDFGSMVAHGADIHMMFVADFLPEDFGDVVYMVRPETLGPDLTPPGVTMSFTATAGNTTVDLSWMNPQDVDFAGTMVRFSTSGFPTTQNDGTFVTNIVGGRAQQRSFTQTNLQNGKTHYYAAFTYDDLDNYSSAVTVTALPFGPADFDKDGDVDQVDFGRFQACLSGSTIPQNDPACQEMKFDEDDDVDQNDFGIFQACMRGAGIPADPQCAD